MEKLRTFSGFCKAHGLQRGTIYRHQDGFVYMHARRAGKNVVIYFDDEEDCVLFY